MNDSLNGTDSVIALPANDIAHQIRVYSVPVLVAIGAAGVAFNCYLLASIRWLEKKAGANLVLSLSLAAADALSALLSETSLILHTYLPMSWKMAMRCAPVVIEALRLGAIITSVLHLLALATNHWMGTAFPLRHKRIMNSCIVKLVLVAMWVLPFGSFFLFFGAVSDQAFLHPKCIMKPYTFSFRLVLFLMITGTFSAVLAIYAFILRRLMRSRADFLKLAMVQPSCYKRRLHAVYTTLMIVGSYGICFLPNVFMFFLLCESGCVFKARYTRDDPSAMFGSLAVNTLMMIKHLVNPLIYTSRILEIRCAIFLMRATRCGLRQLPPNFIQTIPKEYLPLLRRPRLLLMIRRATLERLHVQPPPAYAGYSPAQRAKARRSAPELYIPLHSIRKAHSTKSQLQRFKSDWLELKLQRLESKPLKQQYVPIYV